MNNIERNEELCPMISDYFDEKDTIFNSSNLIQNISIKSYNFSAFSNDQNLNDQIKPFFLVQAKQASSLLQSTENNLEINEFINKKATCQTQIDIEPKFEFNE